MTKTAQLRVSLDRILSSRNVTTYRLMKQLEGRVSRGTVYSLASGNVQRIDLETLAGIMAGLEELTGETITPNDLLEVIEEPVPPLQFLKPGETDGPQLVTIPAQGKFKPRPPMLKNPTGVSVTAVISEARGER
jgi:DNA-binding Xre family transcriptional regulator